MYLRITIRMHHLITLREDYLFHEFKTFVLYLSILVRSRVFRIRLKLVRGIKFDKTSPRHTASFSCACTCVFLYVYIRARVRAYNTSKRGKRRLGELGTGWHCCWCTDSILFRHDKWLNEALFEPFSRRHYLPWASLLSDLSQLLLSSFFDARPAVRAPRSLTVRRPRPF